MDAPQLQNSGLSTGVTVEVHGELFQTSGALSHRHLCQEATSP